MDLAIDETNAEPLYLQIRTGIVNAIAVGELSAGESLPSIRTLAADLGVNLHTVNRAYSVLREEGYVVMRGRRGAFIADTRLPSLDEKRVEAVEEICQELEQLALEYRARGGNRDGFVELAEESSIRAFEAASAPVGETEAEILTPETVIEKEQVEAQTPPVQPGSVVRYLFPREIQ